MFCLFIVLNTMEIFLLKENIFYVGKCLLDSMGKGRNFQLPSIFYYEFSNGLLSFFFFS